MGETVPIYIARFLVRVQVEEQIQGKIPKKRPRSPYLGSLFIVSEKGWCKLDRKYRHNRQDRKL